jgi:hypothetical protein
MLPKSHVSFGLEIKTDGILWYWGSGDCHHVYDVIIFKILKLLIFVHTHPLLNWQVQSVQLWFPFCSWTFISHICLLVQFCCGPNVPKVSTSNHCYHSTLAASTLIILFSEMLKILTKNIIQSSKSCEGKAENFFKKIFYFSTCNRHNKIIIRHCYAELCYGTSSWYSH